VNKFGRGVGERVERDDRFQSLVAMPLRIISVQKDVTEEKGRDSRYD